MANKENISLSLNEWEEMNKIYSFLVLCVVPEDLLNGNNIRDRYIALKSNERRELILDYLLKIGKSQFYETYTKEKTISVNTYHNFCDVCKKIIDRGKDRGNYREIKSLFKNWETRLNPKFPERDGIQISEIGNTIYPSKYPDQESFFNHTEWTIIVGVEVTQNKKKNPFRLNEKYNLKLRPDVFNGGLEYTLYNPQIRTYYCDKAIISKKGDLKIGLNITGIGFEFGLFSRHLITVFEKNIVAPGYYKTTEITGNGKLKHKIYYAIFYKSLGSSFDLMLNEIRDIKMNIKMKEGNIKCPNSDKLKAYLFTTFNDSNYSNQIKLILSKKEGTWKQSPFLFDLKLPINDKPNISGIA